MLSPRVDLFAECDSAPPGHILSGLSFLTPTVSGAQMEDGGFCCSCHVDLALQYTDDASVQGQRGLCHLSSTCRGQSVSEV